MMPSQLHPPAALTNSVANILLAPQDVIDQFSLLHIPTPVSARWDILAIPDVWFTAEAAAEGRER
jgi:hypothetical protein